MAHAKISAADMKAIRAKAQRHQKRGLSPSQALGQALDEEIAASEKLLESVREQATPRPEPKKHNPYDIE